MIILEVANVNELGKGFEGEISIADDDKLPGLTKLAAAAKSGGAKAILQLFSAGRQSSTAILRGKQPISSSDIPYPRGDYEKPRPLSHEEVVETIEAFGQATKRAILAGFDGVEIHGANLYLLQQFFSPNANHRQDLWGGDLEKRMRFGLAVAAKVRQVIDKETDRPFLLGYRQSPEEPMEDGITVKESLAFTDKMLDTVAIDYWHLSMKSAFQSSFKNQDDPELIVHKYQKVIAKRTPMMVAGLIKRPEEAEDLMDLGLDFVAMARELIVEPRWVQKVQNDDEGAIRYAISPSDFDILAVPKPLEKWLLTKFKNGLPVTTDPEFNPKAPWAYYKSTDKVKPD